jgi:iron complex outermembrane receptor protein
MTTRPKPQRNETRRPYYRRADRLKLGTALASAALAFALPASAQTAAVAPATTTAGTATRDTGTTNVNQIQQVVVTARRKSEKLQNVPLAITAISAAKLKAASATSLQDITFLTPGLTYNSNGQQNDAAPVIRGLSDTSGGEATSQNVSVFLDGVYIYNPSAFDLSVGGLDRVEVVEGPVSGLYGRNAFTGAINYVTAAPTNTFHTDDAVTIGSNGRRTVDVGVSGPIIPDLLSGRIAYTYDNLDGTFTDPVSHEQGNGHNRNDFLGTLKFTPDEHITITPVVYLGYDTFNAPVSVTYAQNCAFGTANSYCGNLADNQIGPHIASPDQSEATGLTRRVEHLHIDNRATYSFGSFDVLAGFNKLSTTTINEFAGSEYGSLYDLYTPGNNNPFAGDQPVGLPPILAKGFFGDHATENDSSVEARYDSPQSLPLRIGFGGYWLYHIETNNNTFGIDGYVINSIAAGYVTNGGQNAGRINYSKAATRDYSGFVSLEYDILPNLTVSTAVRDTDEEQKQYSLASQFSLPQNDAAEFHAITSNEALTFKPTKDYTFYVSAANGAKSGGFNGGAASTEDLTFQPEADWDYEGGVKSLLLDGHLRLTASAFHTDVSNLQVLGPPSTAGAIALVVKNFGDLSTNGFELQGDYALGNGFRVFAGYSYTRPRFDANSYDFNDAASCVLVPSCANTRLITVKGQQAVNLEGLRPPFSSDQTLTTSIEYRAPTGWRDVDWFARFDYRLESEQYSTVTNFAYLGPRNVLNVHAGLSNDTWTLTGYVLNLTNDLTPVTQQYNGQLNGFDPPPNGDLGVNWVPVSVLPEGRTFAFRLAYHF